MKHSLGISRLVVLSSSVLLLGCEDSATPVDREAEVKCESTDWWTPPGGHKDLPERIEAEELFAWVPFRTVQKVDKDTQASKKRVHRVRFKQADGAYSYSFKPHTAADVEVWLRYRTGVDQGMWNAWVNDDESAKTSVEGYSKAVTFVEVKVGTIHGTTSHKKPWQTVHIALSGRNASSSAYEVTIDFIELRAMKADTSPCGSQPDGTSCDDADACTLVDTCQAGICVGGSAVVCAAMDACHAAGGCDSATGACSNPALPDGTTCDDGDLCTQQDSCQAGSCTSGNPVVCSAQDACHVVGVCDAATGTCSNPAQPDGTTCDDGTLCTQQDSCQAGSCVGGNPVTCPNAPNCLVQGACVPATGECSAADQCTLCGNSQMDPGEECEDGNRFSDDACGPSCKYETCGDGILQSTPIQSLTFYYLARACNVGPSFLTIRINGVVVAHEQLPATCDCLPGIRTLHVLDPALRAASVNGSNSIELSSDGELAWALAVIYTRNMAMGMPLWDWNGGNDVGFQNPDICAAGALSGFGLGMGIGLSGGETCDDGNTTDGDGCSSTCEATP